MSLLRIPERQLPSNGDSQLFTLHCLRHVQKDFGVGGCVYGDHLNGWIVLGILWNSEDRRQDPASFDFADQRFRGLPVYRISHGIVGCNNPIRAQARRLLDLAFENPGNHDRTAILRSEYRRTADITDGSGDE